MHIKKKLIPFKIQIWPDFNNIVVEKKEEAVETNILSFC